MNVTTVRIAEIGLKMHDFLQEMQKISKSTPYPAKQLDKMLDEIGYAKYRNIVSKLTW